MAGADAVGPGHSLVVAARMRTLHNLRDEGGNPLYTDSLVARRMDVDRTTIAGLRNGRSYHGVGRPRKEPSVDFLIKLALVGYGLDEKDKYHFVRPDPRVSPEAAARRLEAVFDRLGVTATAERTLLVGELRALDGDDALVPGLEKLAAGLEELAVEREHGPVEDSD